MVYLDAGRVAATMRRALESRDVVPEAIRHVVDSLVQTSLRGVDSHGINLFPHYCRAIDGGRIARQPDMTFERTAASTLILDAGHAFGHHAGALAMEQAVELARETGMAAVAVRNSTHFGAAAYFSLRAAQQDCIGLAFCNADALVKAHNSIESFFGTNPICCAAPMANEEPFILDMATSLAAWNKVANARSAGSVIPPDWAFDEFGGPVTDPGLARSLAPSGSYKGFGLGMMVDIFCALLANGPMSKDILAMYGAPLSARRSISHFFMVIDIAKFVPVEVFKTRLQEMADRIRTLPRMPDADDVMMVAGDPEKRTFRTRSAKGIPMNEERYSEFLEISDDFEQARLHA